jgi:hypothetical protein
LVDDWLRAHAVHRIAFDDVYDACLHLLREPQPVPLLVFIGSDWLMPEELVIAQYARQVWSSTPCLVYGSEPRFALHPSPFGEQVFRSRAALRELLQGPPEHVADQLRASTPTAATSVVAARPAAAGQPGQRDARPGLSISSPEDEPPRSILTNEELSALLDDLDE